MPATSPKQKRFMTMVKARKSGHPIGGAGVAKAAGEMTMSQVNDFVQSPVKTQPARSTGAMKSKMWAKKK